MFKTLTPRREASGFTLIELLVVIAIIAILAAILFPVFGRARENARRSSCQSNLKQIGLGIMQYTQDYDETFPQIVENGPVSTPEPKSWVQILNPYIKSYQIWQCPSDTTSGATPYNAYWPGATVAESDHTDYFYNGLVGQPPGSTGLKYWEGMRVAKLESVATGIIAGDQNPTTAAEYGGWKGQGAKSINTNYNATTNSNGAYCYGILGEVSNGNYGCEDIVTIDRKGAAMRHLGGANYMFADGHVKFQKPTQIYGGGTPLTVSGGSPTFNLYEH